MANIVPIIATPNTTTQSSPDTALATGNESTFGSILDQKVAENNNLPQKTPAKDTISEDKNTSSATKELTQSQDNTTTPITSDTQATLTTHNRASGVLSGNRDGDISSLIGIVEKTTDIPRETKATSPSVIPSNPPASQLFSETGNGNQAFAIENEVVDTSLGKSPLITEHDNNDIADLLSRTNQLKSENPTTVPSISNESATTGNLSQIGPGISQDFESIAATSKQPIQPVANETAEKLPIQDKASNTNILESSSNTLASTISSTPAATTDPSTLTHFTSANGQASLLPVSPKETPAFLNKWTATAALSYEKQDGVSDYSAIPKVTNIPTGSDGQSVISSQLNSLITANEKGVIEISQTRSGATTITNSTIFNTSFQSSIITANSTIQSQTAPASSELTQLVASFSQLTNVKPLENSGSEKPLPTQPEQLRQDMKGQFLQTKIDSQSSQDSFAKNQQSGQQEMTTAPQLVSSQISSTTLSEQTLSFSQISQGMLTQAAPQNSLTPAAPSVPMTQSPHVFEESVVNQVMDRFHFHTRNQETLLNIKLHPAELGELKIELSMKEGSIRAHVVAQSGQVQQILEKNMDRLKGMLEGQGFTIEELLVSAKSENVGDFDLLHDQNQQQHPDTEHKSQTAASNFNETFENLVTAVEAPVEGVNITA